MTLKARNYLLLEFFACSALCCLGGIGFFVYSAVNGAVVAPADAVRTFTLFVPAVACRFSAAIAGIVAFLLLVPLITLMLYFSFEKTQSQEVLFFMEFLLGCLAEGVRILMPIDDLWQTSSASLIVLGRVVITGRVLTHLSLLFSALFSGVDQRQYVERNCAILLLISVFIGTIYPMDTMFTTSTCTVLWGYRTLFTVLRLVIFASALVVILFQAYTGGSSEQWREAAGSVLLMAGYALLTVTDNYLYFIAGLALFAGGTLLYLRSIHRLYLWR